MFGGSQIHKAFFVQARTALRPSTFDNTYELLRCSRNPSNIRIPLIYFVNRSILMFGESQIHKAFFVQARTALRPSTFDNTYELLRCSRNPSNIRIPLIYFVNRSILMFGESQIHKAFFVRARTALCIFDPGIIICCLCSL